MFNLIYIWIKCKHHKWKLLGSCLWHGEKLYVGMSNQCRPTHRTADFRCKKCGIYKSGTLNEIDVFDADSMIEAGINDSETRHYILEEVSEK